MAKTTALFHNKGEVPQAFDTIASLYDLATFLSQGYSSDLALSVERMKLQGHEKLLDLCCGTGKSTLPCLEATPQGHVTAVDYSQGMLDVAKRKLSPSYGPERLTLSWQDAMKLDFPDGSFDAIFMAYGIRNMPDPQACLRQLHRLLKPGGIIAFHEYALAERPYARPYWFLLGYGFIFPFCSLLTLRPRIFWYLIRSVFHFPRPSVFLSQLQDAGFEATEALPLPSWRSPILHTFLAKKPL